MGNLNEQAKNDLKNILKRLGVTSGRTVFVQSELFGFIDAARTFKPSGLVKIVFESLCESVGNNGTVVVPTFTTDCARKGLPFDLKHTKCDTGVLAEYIRNFQGSYRSLHPVLSVSAIGRLAEYYTQNTSSGCYCWDSSFDRIAGEDTIVVRFGMPWSLSNTFSHYVDIKLNLPYLFNKLLDYIKVTINGKPVERTFYMTVRYLDYDITYYQDRQIEMLKKSGSMRFGKWGGGKLNAIDLDKYLSLLKRHLIDNPYFLLENPPSFRLGIAPYDGPPEPFERN